MKLYLLRHGQTDYNNKKIIQGDLPIELNENGKKQAIDVKNQIEKLNIDLIISSPIKRAVQTAEIINQDLNVEFITDNRISERKFNKAIGQNEKFYVDNLELYWDLDKNFSGEYSVERTSKLVQRTKSFLQEIKNKYNDKTVLVISHGSPIAALVKNITGENIKETEIKNCALLEYKCQ